MFQSNPQKSCNHRRGHIVLLDAGFKSIPSKVSSFAARGAPPEPLSQYYHYGEHRMRALQERENRQGGARDREQGGEREEDKRVVTFRELRRVALSGFPTRHNQ